MIIAEFPGQTVIYAKDQPQYRPLPAYRDPLDHKGRIICCWKLSLWERLKVLITGRLWHHVLTFHEPLQPQFMSTDKPEML